MRLRAITFEAHDELSQIRSRCKSDQDYFDAIWRLREPIMPYSRGKWPIQRGSDLPPANVEALRPKKVGER
jgi:hypothetical protein